MKTKGNSRYSVIFLRASHYTTSIRALIGVCCIVTFFLWGCDPASTENENCETFSTATDHFPYKTKIKYAKGFSIRYYNSYKILNIINPFKSNEDTLRYALVQRGSLPPAGFNHNRIIEIPIRNLICLSTTHLALADLLEVPELVTGLSDTNFICNTIFRNRIKYNHIQEIGRGHTLNKELIISMNPQLMMAVGQQENTPDNYQTLEDSGINVLINSEWMEVSPLGRTEWVKVLAALLNKEQLAEEKFNQIEYRYQELKHLAKSVKHKPSVIVGDAYKGTWSLPGGNSYVANLLRDAGADYYYSTDTTAGNLTISLEAAYELALHADYWLNPGAARTLQEVEAQDIRYKQFKPYRNGSIYNNTKRICPGGGNDYWESGLVNPHLILSDLIKILHPALLQDHETIFYEKLKTR